MSRRGGDGADCEGGHDQDGVPQDGVVEAHLGLVEAEPVLGELEVFFDGPSEPGGADEAGHVGLRHVTTRRDHPRVKRPVAAAR